MSERASQAAFLAAEERNERRDERSREEPGTGLSERASQAAFLAAEERNERRDERSREEPGRGLRAIREAPTPAPAIDVVAERLDEPVVLIPLRLWVGVAALLVILGGFAVWGWFGTWSRQLTENAVVAQHRGGPAAALLITDRNDLASLKPGAPVLLSGPSGAVAGWISGIAAAPVTGTAVVAQWQLPLSGLPADDGPVWVAQVRLAPGQHVAVAGSATATVELPSIRPYQLVFGSGQ